MTGSKEGGSSNAEAPKGDAPQAEGPMNRQGVQNGVPDGTESAEPTARPSSDRQDTETAAGGDEKKGDRSGGAA